MHHLAPASKSPLLAYHGSIVLKDYQNCEVVSNAMSNVGLKATKGAAVPAGPAQAWINTVHEKRSPDARSACKNMNAITSVVGNLEAPSTRGQGLIAGIHDKEAPFAAGQGGSFRLGRTFPSGTSSGMI